MNGNGKAVLVLGGFILLAYFALTSGHPSETPKPEPVATYAPPTVTHTVSPPPAAPTTYTVQAGDGLMAIANAHGVTLAALMQANGFTTSEVTINPGDVLRLPSGAQASPTATTYQPMPRAPTHVATSYPTVPIATAYATTYPATEPLPVPTFAPTYRSTPQTYSTGWAASCPNGSCYGQPSSVNGQPRTHLVHGKTGDYYRSK